MNENKCILKIDFHLRGLSEHSANNFSDIIIEFIITNCPPFVMKHHLHSARIRIVPTDKPDKRILQNE